MSVVFDPKRLQPKSVFGCEGFRCEVLHVFGPRMFSVPSFAVSGSLSVSNEYIKNWVEQGSTLGLSYTQPTILPIGLVCHTFNVFTF